jgi:hypothetical protein
MGQMGHESAGLALEVYAKVMERKRQTGARMDEKTALSLSPRWQTKSPLRGGLSEAGGKDSNLDYPTGERLPACGREAC